MKSVPSRVRVTSGSAGGLFLKIPGRFPSRPTQDRIKQAIFSSLGALVPGSTFLDIYAGTGSLGIEALSRGAESVVFVDSDKNCCLVIRENLEHCHLAGNVICQEAELYLSGCAESQFDLIVSDPPYIKEKKDMATNSTLLQTLPKLKPGGILVWEHDSYNTLTTPLTTGTLIKTVRYGETSVTYIRRND